MVYFFINEVWVIGEYGYYYLVVLVILVEILVDYFDKDICFWKFVIWVSVELLLYDFWQVLEIVEVVVKFNFYNVQIYGVFVDVNVELG